MTATEPTPDEYRLAADILERHATAAGLTYPEVGGYSAKDFRNFAQKAEKRLIITVDLNTWSRRAEIVQYADTYGLTLEEAVEALVNQGLSNP